MVLDEQSLRSRAQAVSSVAVSGRSQPLQLRCGMVPKPAVVPVQAVDVALGGLSDDHSSAGYHCG